MKRLNYQSGDNKSIGTGSIGKKGGGNTPGVGARGGAISNQNLCFANAVEEVKHDEEEDQLPMRRRQARFKMIQDKNEFNADSK